MAPYRLNAGDQSAPVNRSPMVEFGRRDASAIAGYELGYRRRDEGWPSRLSCWFTFDWQQLDPRDRALAPRATRRHHRRPGPHSQHCRKGRTRRWACSAGQHRLGCEYRGGSNRTS